MKNKTLLTCLLALFTLTAVSQTRPINPLRIETGEITALNLGADSLLSLSHKVGDGAIYVNDTTLEDWVGQYASANPAGATTQIQYNNAGAFGASANLTTDGGSLAVDNVTIDGNTISTTNTNGNLTLSPNGTGVITTINGINTGANNFVIKPNTTFGSDDNSLTISAGGDVGHLRGAFITINGNQVGSFLDGAIRYHTGNNTTHSKHVFFTSGSGKFQITNDGSVVAGSPTGSGKGFGTINAQGIFINDVAVSAGAHTTINTNADNRIITGSNTANTLNGQADLTFSGGVLGVTGSLEVDDLTLNGNDITTATNTDLTLDPNGTGILDVQSDATFSGNVNVSQTAASSAVKIANTGNGNLSSINWLRERSSGVGQTGASMWLASNTATNEAVLTLDINSSTAAGNSGGTGFTANSTDVFQIRTAGTVGITLDSSQKATFSGDLLANVDNTQDIGTSSIRFQDAYVAGGVTTTSDARLKDNIQDYPSVLDQVIQLQPRVFDSKYDDYDVGSAGFIAQELEAVFPQLIKEHPDTLTLQDSSVFINNVKSISVISPEMIAILVKSIQELEARLTEVEKGQ